MQTRQHALLRRLSYHTVGSVSEVATQHTNNADNVQENHSEQINEAASESKSDDSVDPDVDAYILVQEARQRQRNPQQQNPRGKSTRQKTSQRPTQCRHSPRLQKKTAPAQPSSALRRRQRAANLGTSAPARSPQNTSVRQRLFTETSSSRRSTRSVIVRDDGDVLLSSDSDEDCDVDGSPLQPLELVNREEDAANLDHSSCEDDNDKEVVQTDNNSVDDNDPSSFLQQLQFAFVDATDDTDRGSKWIGSKAPEEYYSRANGIWFGVAGSFTTPLECVAKCGGLNYDLISRLTASTNNYYKKHI